MESGYDIEERLKVLISGCTWVREVSRAVQLVPGLADDLPPLCSLPGAQGEPTSLIPMPASADLFTALGLVMKRARAR
jgi:hypothetical protein